MAAEKPLRSKMLAQALGYAARGWRVIPLHTPLQQGGCSCGQPECGKNTGKHPRTKNGLKDGSTEVSRIEGWWGTWPHANVAVVTGAISGLLVLDIDPDKGGLESFKGIQEVYGPFPPTLASLTGGGGWHLVYKHPGGVLFLGNRTRLAGFAGLDVRGDGGYIVAPPSYHMSGARYAWYETTDGTPREIADPPDWLLLLLQEERNQEDERTPRPPGEATLEEAARSLEHWTARYAPLAVEGSRNDMAFQWACQLRDDGVLQEDAEHNAALFYDAIEDRAGFALREVTQAIKHAYTRENPRPRARRQEPPSFTQDARESGAQPGHHGHGARADGMGGRGEGAQAGMGEGGGRGSMGGDGGTQDGAPDPPPPGARKKYPHTEMGNAERMFDAYGQDIRYNKALDFLVWDGRRWRAESELTVRRWAKLTIRGVYREGRDLADAAAKSDDEHTREELAKEAESLLAWARKSERAQMVSAMLKHLTPDVDVSPDLFDARPWLLNCHNGTLDLKTGQLREHRRDDYLMQMTRVEYDPAATCPTFERFLHQIMLERTGLVGYLQRALGYSLTGDTSEQVWHLLHGEEGDNGKSTLMEVIDAVLGDYAGTMQPESITINGAKRDAAAPSPDIAELKGKRFVKASETEEGARIAPARIKQMSGGDLLSGRFLHRDMIHFLPCFKLWIHTNHKPQARETTHAFWRRVRLIPFDFSVKDRPDLKDEHLKDRLLTEAPGILAWLVRGCLAWQQGGLQPPAEVLEATQGYRSEMDVLGKFLEECCLANPGYRVKARVLWNAWKSWCEENNEREQNQRAFGMALGKHGPFTREHKRDGWEWQGLGLLSEYGL